MYSYEVPPARRLAGVAAFQRSDRELRGAFDNVKGEGLLAVFAIGKATRDTVVFVEGEGAVAIGIDVEVELAHVAEEGSTDDKP